MIIDVLINSCARPDVLEVSINTFKKHIKTTHTFRYIILEDRVENKIRQEVGKKWIDNNKDLFDKIHFVDKKMGPGFFFAPIVSLCKSDYFFHLEDDNEFIVDIDIDPILDVMQNNDYIIEVMLSRGKVDKRNNPRKVFIDKLKLTEFNLFSVATGIFNTKLVNKVIDKVGWKNQLHEAGVLTPITNKLKFKRFMLGHNEKHYTHLGMKKGYIKGGWRIN